MDKVITGREGIRKVADDILVDAPSLSILTKHIHALHEEHRQHNFTCKPTKSPDALSEVNICGYHPFRTLCEIFSDRAIII